MGRYDRTIAERIRASLTVVGECWESSYAKRKYYPQMKIDGRQVSLHRAAYAAFVGSIPEGAWVLHKCDNRRCCRPDHLYLGDRRRNIQDAVDRKRLPGGKPRLDPWIDEMIRALHVLSQKDIAECVGVSQAEVSRVLREAGLGRTRHTSFGKNHGRGGWKARKQW